MARVEVFQKITKPDGRVEILDLYARSPKDIDGMERAFLVDTSEGIVHTRIIPAFGTEPKAGIFQADPHTKKGGEGVVEIHGAPFKKIAELRDSQPFPVLTTKIGENIVTFTTQVVPELITLPINDEYDILPIVIPAAAD